VFECVGAAGLIQELIDSCQPGTRIYAAGGWYTYDTINVTSASKKGLMMQFGGGPRTVDWDRTLEAVCTGTLDPLPSVGRVIGLDEVPAALDEVRRAEGPLRIVVHPNGDVPSGDARS
jgi:threonine dehydrogenase-like Zn-dependent dehydrogenase